MELSLLVIVLTAIHSNCNAITWESRITEVKVTGKWQMILDHDNQNSEPATLSRTLTRGFQSTEQKSDVLRATHNVGTTIQTEIVFKILKVIASIKYEYTHSTETITMNSWEITHSVEITSTAVIPARSRLIRWQLVVDVGGYDIGFLKIIDSLNSSSVPLSSELTVKALVVLPQTIELCQTPLRIKHKATEKYITVTTRMNWPAATLSWANNYYFKICPSTAYCWKKNSCPNNRENATGLDSCEKSKHCNERHNQFRVYTLNSTHSNYRTMYSSDAGGIYFDYADSDENYYAGDKTRWELSKSLPLRDNDVITFRNVNWPTAYLCRHEGPSTSVYCLDQQDDQWIIEM